MEPSAVSVAGRIALAGRRRCPVFAALHALPVLPHVLRVPRRVVGPLGDLVPVAVVRHDRDHRVVRGAAAERAGARIENPLALDVLLFVALRVGPIMVDVKAPRHLRNLGGEGVEGGDLVLVRFRVAARLDQADAKTLDGEVRRQGSAAGSGADDDVVVRFDRRLLRTSSTARSALAYPARGDSCRTRVPCPHRSRGTC